MAIISNKLVTVGGYNKEHNHATNSLLTLSIGFLYNVWTEDLLPMSTCRMDRRSAPYVHLSHGQNMSTCRMDRRSAPYVHLSHGQICPLCPLIAWTEDLPSISTYRMDRRSAPYVHLSHGQKICPLCPLVTWTQQLQAPIHSLWWLVRAEHF